MLVKCLSKDKHAAYVAHHESACQSKNNKCQVKTFDSTMPVDVVSNIYDIPFEDIETSIYGCNSKHNHTNILNNIESTY